jgi:hypothetical protein
MTPEDFQARAQALLDSWTSTGSEMRNTIDWRDAVAAALEQAFADGQEDAGKRIEAAIAAIP